MPYTEQQIRGLAINFLRFHYKLRPRYAGGGTRIVDRPHYYQGVLIDARLAYQKPDRSYFTATVEATSVDRREEVLYQTNYWRIGAHSLTLTLLVSALLAWAGALIPGYNLWERYGSPRVYLVILAILAAVFATCWLLLRRRRTYRYIYAVDQFKHFYADAQWVAYDVEIFAADTFRTRRRYRELERQCIKYGFGLLAVEADRVVRTVITPSQVDQFSGNRLRLPKWLARAEEARTLPPEVMDPLAPDEPLTAVLPARPGRPAISRQLRKRGILLRARLRRTYRNLFPGGLRRRPGYYRLGGWVFFVGVPSLLFLTAGLYRQSTYSPLAQEGKKYAEPDLGFLESAADPAPPLEVEEGEYRRTTDTTDAPTAATVNVPEEALVSAAEVTDIGRVQRYRIDSTGVVTVDYDCVPLDQLTQPVFLLVFGRYETFVRAREWALELNRLYRSTVTVAAGNCVEASATDYLLYIDAPTTDEGAANFLARTFIRESGLEVEILEIR
ncbi:hypothetical protein [Lewinella sp. JB7]|uniref:hypothetical protein n=1 Tax=Lewinella sp. JB7 TaxID=2962887 RepID=UPI0020C9BA26|nr:hypothetical protein [Lewinella sp. JB7]MCP9236531.1 hypothetical protein [Lewinella sp. JB7]